jgi:NAD(P)-dependent dehydrogenase (short-subunit alcohol dehydrogenase family)
MNYETWQRILSANLTGAYLTTYHALPLLADDAHIMFVGAIQERLRLPGLSVYAAAKAGLEAFAEALRKEQRKKHITVFRPGAVDTPLWDKVPMNLPKDAMTAAKLADKMIEAYYNQQSGIIDFTH